MNKIELFLKVFQKFEKLVKEASGSTDSTRLLDAVRKLASTNSFIAVNFEFIPENMSLYEVPSLFEKSVSQRKRLDCLLITKTGKRNNKITGIITPWDLGSI